jgi:hypothetical protein
MGVLAAVLVWEIERVGSVVLALVIATVAVSIGTLILKRLRRNIDADELRQALRRIGCCQAKPRAEATLDPAPTSREAWRDDEQ